MKTTVISVNSIPERDIKVRELYHTLTRNPNKNFIIQQDRVNRIKIFHNKGGLRILLKIYTVVILPVLLNFSPLDSIYGTVDFQLDNTIEKLELLTRKLRSIQGTRTVNGKVGAQKLKNALNNLL
ncbi:MAG: hypothetical protein GY714_20185 [Desulfobacterales bacterium]|nr:hypothetical protein [Desulfobacterales bacterium]